MGIVRERMSSTNSSNQRVFIVCLPCVMHYSGHCNAAMMHEAPVGLPLKKDDCCAREVVVEFSPKRRRPQSQHTLFSILRPFSMI